MAISRINPDRQTDGAEVHPDSATHRLAMVTPPHEREAALQVLLETLGMSVIDARTRLRHVPAVWPEVYREDQVKEAVARLTDLGATASLVSESQVAALQTARTLHHVRCERAGLVILAITGQPEQTIDWANIEWLSVADVAGLHQHPASVVPDGVFRHSSGIARIGSKTQEHGLELWLIAHTPRQLFRIDADLMNYEYLAERLSPSTESNFETLVRDIVRQAPHIALTPYAEEYLKEPSHPGHRMGSSAAHRDAVLAHWAVRCTPTAQPQRSSPIPEGVAESSPATSRDRLSRAHHRLHSEIAQLRSICADANANGSIEPGEIEALLKELHQTISEHFDLEEEGGYLGDVLEISPRYSRLAAELRRQHQMLRERLERLMAESKDLTTDVEEFIAALEAHEHAENALVQSSYLDDVAAGD